MVELKDDRDRLKSEKYEDSPWTREEIEALAWDASEGSEWEEYDDDSEKR